MRTKKISSIALCLLFIASFVKAQKTLEKILWSSNTFEEIVAEGETYFKEKHPNMELNKLAIGEFRDSEYVKFMRWQSYWKHSLSEEGKLANVDAFISAGRKKMSSSEKSLSPYRNVEWENLSYEDYITSQIGMGRTTSIGFHPTDANTFYVGSAIGGIWRTRDGGQNYTPLGDDLPFMAVSSIIVHKNDPSNIFIAISDHVWYGPPSIGVYRSTDGGANWVSTALSFEMKDNVRIYWMEADSNNPDKMFVATSEGLYRTDFRFQSIVKVNSIPTFDVKINPGNSNIVYQGGLNGEFLRSTNGGSTFSEVEDFRNGSVYAAVTALNPSKVYVRNKQTLHKSLDNGATFSSREGLPVNNSVLAFAPSNQDILLAGNFETNRSDNGGTSFYPTSQWLGRNGLPLIHVDQRNIFTNPLENDYVYYCNDGGVYRYVVSSNSFENISDGLKITQFYDIAVSQTDPEVISGGSQDNGNVFRESDGVWDDYAPTGDGMNQEIDPTDANIRYWAYQNGLLYRWENGRNTYIAPFGKSGTWETPFRLDPNNAQRIVAGYNAVYVSDNKGTNWTDISGEIFGGDLNEIAIAKSNSNRIYASRGSQLFVKDISSNTWTSKTMPGSAADLEVDPKNMNMIYIVVSGYNEEKKVYKSTDAGTSWENIGRSLPNVSVDAVELYEEIDGAIFIGTDIGVFYRDNTQKDWLEYGDLPNTRVDDIEIQYSAGLIRVGTHGRGVLQAPIIIETCTYGDPDEDNDGICNANDACPNFDNRLIGTPCDDGDPNTTGEVYTSECECGTRSVYCEARANYGTGGDWIKNVQFNTIEKNSKKSLYSNFRDWNTDLARGVSYPIEVTLNYAFEGNEVYTWIDFDQDGVFEGTEQITLMNPGAGWNKIYTGTVNVPAGAMQGKTGMRVRAQYGDATPCGSSSAGEVEDYTVNITYCAAKGATGTGGDYINRVQLHTFNHSSGKTPYSDFTHISTNLIRGASYPLEVQLSYAFNLDKVYAWIDYDKNGTFEDDEQIAMSDLAVGWNKVARGTIQVPADAVQGKTRMRVRVIYSNSSTGNACGDLFGEVEDYTVNLMYCVAAGSRGTGDDWIKRVQLNTLDHSSGKSTYSNFQDKRTTLERGGDYTLNVTMNYHFNADKVHAWIDFDQNGAFTSDEHITLPKPSPGWNRVSTASFSVDTEALLGETIMRVRAIYANDPNPANPCGTYAGEVEDYTVIIGEHSSSIASIGTRSEVVENSSENVQPSIRESASLMAFPNPFQTQANINYTLTEATPVKVIVTDISGRQLKVLFDTPWQNAGSYQLTWEKTLNSSGVFLLQLITKDKVLVEKLVAK